MAGGAFVIDGPGRIFMPEELGEDQQAIGRLIDEFWARDVEPRLPALRRQEPGVARALLTTAAELGLTAMQIPEAYGGLALDLSSMMVAVEHLADDASYLGWHLGHCGIGTLPLVYYGTDDQQRRYLPRLASMELLAAYALTEPEAGSDAMAIRTRADLSTDGRAYVLNGRKMWITNGGEADLFTVFAKVGGEAFTAFLVERAFGVRSGAPEHKMGIEGTSTTALYFDDVRVPVENVLGQVGRGHEIAFNVLNVGRLEIGPNACRGARKVLDVSARYACDRRAFGRPIAEFGAIRTMLAEAATRLFASESTTWRVVGLVQDAIAARRLAGESAVAAEVAAFEEFAIECAIVKVHASEMLDDVADTGVQVHGGYGYHRDYFVERAYRDARINRIFEGTNEINRILIAGQLFRRDAKGRLPLVASANAAVARAADLAAAPPGHDGVGLVARARLLTQLVAGLLARRYGGQLREEQEVAMCLADAAIETFAMESAVLRARQLAGTARGVAADAMAGLYARDALRRVVRAAEVVTGAAAADDASVTRAVQVLGMVPPVDVVALRRLVAADVIGRTG